MMNAKKVLGFLRQKKAAVSIFSAVLASLAMAVTASAEGGATTVSVSDFQSIITALTNQISVSTIVAVIASVVGITVGIAFMWWGARYASRKIMAALKKGKAGP